MIIEPWHWFVLGVALLIVEMFTLTFASLWFGVAALVVALLTWLMPLTLTMQVIIWLLVSVVCVFVWFKFIKPLSVDKTKAGLGGSVIIGETGLITVKPQGKQAGTVRFSVPVVGATEWQCRKLANEVVEIGDKVIVTDIVGNELVVKITR